MTETPVSLHRPIIIRESESQKLVTYTHIKTTKNEIILTSQPTGRTLHIKSLDNTNTHVGLFTINVNEPITQNIIRKLISRRILEWVGNTGDEDEDDLYSLYAVKSNQHIA